MWFLAVGLGCGDGETPAESRPIDDDGDGAALGTDCDDADANVHPGADERCNAIDDDCDGPVDEDPVDAVTVYADADADGYGGEPDGTACAPGVAQVSESGDCDDADPGAHPGAVEICNGGVDDDCNGAADDADAALGTTNWYADEDHDGFGGGAPSSSCVAPPDRIADGSDCDDAEGAVNPDAVEVCNGIDDDCDPVTSETGMVWRGGILYWAIQDAIDAAFDGDLVEICSGTFYENLVIDKPIELAGVSADLTILDGSAQERAVISVVRPRVLLTVRSVTVQNGTSATEPGGIAAIDAGGLVVADSVVAHNSGYGGGGIAGPDDGPTSILASVVTQNTSTTSGGGITLYSNGVDLVEVRDSEITNNTCSVRGCGIGVFDSTTTRLQVASATITDTLIDGNVADGPPGSIGDGGGIYAYALNLAGVTVSNNEALGSGGGIFVVVGAVADDKTVISGNLAPEYGGGIYLSSDETWQYGTIEGNTAAYGGGIALTGWGQALDVVLQGNTATTAGGGAYMGGRAELRNSRILSNVSDGGGGGIYATDSYAHDAAAVVDCVVESNVAATEGGGALAYAMDFHSVSTDWGAGATDNAPDDVVFYRGDSTPVIVLDDLETDVTLQCDVSDAVCE